MQFFIVYLLRNHRQTWLLIMIIESMFCQLFKISRELSQMNFIVNFDVVDICPFYPVQQTNLCSRCDATISICCVNPRSQGKYTLCNCRWCFHRSWTLPFEDFVQFALPSSKSKKIWRALLIPTTILNSLRVRMFDCCTQKMFSCCSTFWGRVLNR